MNLMHIGAALVVITAGAFACDELAVEPGTSLDGGSVEVWSGYVDRMQFNSGSDRITLSFTSPSEGTLVFGDGPVAAPAVDPNAFYPPGCDAPAGSLPFRCLDQFAFTLLDVSREHGRLRFSFERGELTAPWCRAQTLLAIRLKNSFTEATYGCLGSPNADKSDYGVCETLPVLPDGGPLESYFADAGGTAEAGVVGCERPAACNVLCRCAAAGCEAQPHPVFFDLFMNDDGDEADGMVDFLGRVHLSKQ